MRTYLAGLLALWVRGDISGSGLWNALWRRPAVIAGKRRAFVVECLRRRPRMKKTAVPAVAGRRRAGLLFQALRGMRSLVPRGGRPQAAGGEVRSPFGRPCTHTAYGPVFSLDAARAARGRGCADGAR